MKQIQIFDPAMCCSTGVCGPSIDPELLRVSFIVSNLSKKEYPIERFNLANDTEHFMKNAKVNQLLNEKGPSVLPIVLVDGQVELTGAYPSNKEFEQWTGFAAEELTQKPKVRLSLKAKKEGN
ncbi:arsenite efflux transporter metallochaperone ArsD [Bacillus testis]|uniref:arsenite efflux transporter metallochaperone ArsD n=1 Tax=Bacillus testis TaxID=1622072 RepID=UPI00067F3434|nr:arsenite efflux transporter metallochaperone ArsD [Bacillus testis]